jgi:roadblock/LC7 domain-containing protein
MTPIGQSQFKKLFAVREKQHDSLEGLLRQPLAITGTLKGGFVGRRGRLVRYDRLNSAYDVVIAAKVLSADNAANKLKLSSYDGLQVGSVKAILADGSAVTVNITQIQGPVYDPVSTLQTNEDFVVIDDPDGAGPQDVADIRYIAPATADLTQKVDGIVYEDSRDANASVAVEVDGARVEHVMGADLPALAATLGLKVIDGLVFFRAS